MGGAIGGLAVILVAKRSDWYNKVFKAALAAAIGWGMGGMISYGVVVGYGRGSDFVNVYYGLLMLFVIGALYGFLGGGLFGLALVESKETKVRWHALLAEMVAFGLLAYGLLINQLEWFMTPPRSELWAACLGASIAVAWYVVRYKHMAVLKVAVWSAFRCGIWICFWKFSAGNRQGSSLPFNFWNIMEYSIGFFGGLGMAYGTLTSRWPVSKRNQRNNLIWSRFSFWWYLFRLFCGTIRLFPKNSTLYLSWEEMQGTIFTVQLIAIVSILAYVLIMIHQILSDIIQLYVSQNNFYFVSGAVYLFEFSAYWNLYSSDRAVFIPG